ncbi:MAG: bis(5'-nucleosyl)-tetraphosphatase (symmetrical) YqeK [Candidatus Caenarcaniphilales bacterium]|nr:bis(5'-nucleosyl)-tetraphosphatase (symmetrical) YqeK [Candidatus Caenarcaniphilales bacterium]
MGIIAQIQIDLRAKLSSGRFKHTEGVANTSRELALKYGADPEKAELAGWLHDIAKEHKTKELLERAELYGLIVDQVDLDSPALLHARVGAKIANEVYRIADPEILQAIACHTLGSPDMCLLSEIVFVADAIEPNRPISWAEPIREALQRGGLSGAILLACKRVIIDLLEGDSTGGGRQIHPLTIATYNAYLRRKSQSD